MAVDTRDKRASVLGLGLGLALVVPTPDGAALTLGDRQQVSYTYRGIAAAMSSLVTYTYTATWQRTRTYTSTWQRTATYLAEFD